MRAAMSRRRCFLRFWFLLLLFGIFAVVVVEILTAISMDTPSLSASSKAYLREQFLHVSLGQRPQKMSGGMEATSTASAILNDNGNRSEMTKREALLAYGRSTEPVSVTLYPTINCTGTSLLKFRQEDFEIGDGIDLCQTVWPRTNSTVQHMMSDGGSILVTGNAGVDLYQQCDGNGPEEAANGYFGTVLPMDGCTRLWNWPPTSHLKQQKNLGDDPRYQSSLVTAPVKERKDFHAVISVESSEYFYMQALASQLSFVKSGSARHGHLTRILTSSEPDDLVDTIPTYTQRRHPYANHYVSLNRKDGLLKWFTSSSAPQEDVIVVLDVDNFLTQDIYPIVKKVTKGRAFANIAWYAHQRKLVTQLWSEICEHPENITACNAQLKVPIDLAAVPYFVHREDLRMILPRWKRLNIQIHERTKDPAFAKRYEGLQIEWCTEMFAYSFAAAEAGVAHELTDYQLRDVNDALFYPKDEEKIKSVYMLHAGRAWFPADYEPGLKWKHGSDEMEGWSHRGYQVWCKCNFTGALIFPWPLPPKIDYCSNVTLTLFHEAQEKYGHPSTSKLRKRGLPWNVTGEYYTSYP